MVRFSNTGAAAAFAAALAPASSMAELTIKPSVDTNTQAEVAFDRVLEFERDLTLGFHTDPSLSVQRQLQEIIDNYTLRDRAGREITGAVDAAPQHDVILGHSGGDAQILKAQRNGAATSVTGLFRDPNGRIVAPRDDQIGAYRMNGEPLCHTRASPPAAAAANPMSIALLLDSSGSMDGIMDEVRAAALSFIDELPDHATCAVGKFAGSWSFDEADGLGVKSCEARNFDLTSLKAYGKTDLFPALEWSYRWLDESARADHQKAVIIITDGHVTSDLRKAEEVARHKNDAVTFVHYLGESDDAWLKDLADNYLRTDDSLSGHIEEYFGVVGDAYAKQTVLNVQACPAQSAAGAP